LGDWKKMDVKEIIIDAIRYPSSDWKKVLIEGVLLILNITVILAFGTGYTLRVLKSTLAGYDQPPEFDDWGGMLIDGFKVYIVEVAYLIIPFIIIFVGAVALITAAITGSIISATVYFELILTVIVGIILLIVFSLFGTIAIANMAFYDKLSAAFKFSEILKRISNIGWGKYILWYIITILITIAAGIIADILRIIPYIGFIIALLVVYSYVFMYSGRSVALIFKSGEEVQKTVVSSNEPVDETKPE
jgi:hypothetical protein